MEVILWQGIQLSMNFNIQYYPLHVECGRYFALTGYPPDHFDLNILCLLSLASVLAGLLQTVVLLCWSCLPCLNHIALLFSTSNFILHISYHDPQHKIVWAKSKSHRNHILDIFLCEFGILTTKGIEKYGFYSFEIERPRLPTSDQFLMY